MSHVQHSAFVFLLDVASNEKFSSFISEMDLNLIRSKDLKWICKYYHFIFEMIILLYLMILILFKIELNLTAK